MTAPSPGWRGTDSEPLKSNMPNFANEDWIALGKVINHNGYDNVASAKHDDRIAFQSDMKNMYAQYQRKVDMKERLKAKLEARKSKSK